MIRSKIAMGSWLLVLMMALYVWPAVVAPAHAQGTRKDDIVFNSRGVPLAGASVRICAMPASGQPCFPLAQIYSDSGLTQALANPTSTDGMGNYFFFAAPGEYEVEISGPGINTKQIPNVLLPNDPSAPNFSGGISAFSLNLSGNLTVNGNTTVVGSLASGTLNLANQATPPGAANTGTVNLYAKTADKRLYYKDDTGTETGPLGIGGGGGGGSPGGGTNTLQKNSGSGSFAAAGVTDDGTNLNVSRDLHTSGPNPNYDLKQFGMYAGVGGSIICSTTASSTSVPCASIGDFAVGQGIAIPKAGVPSSFAPWGVATITGYSRSSNVASLTYSGPTFGVGQTITISGLADATFNGTFTVTANDGDFGHITMPNTGSNVGFTAGSGTATLTSAQVVVTPQGILNGTTTYAYQIVLRGYHGEMSAPSNAGTTTTGAATLGVNTVNLSGCTRASGVATCTSTVAHNFQAGVLTDVEGVSDFAFNGAHQIVATPTSTTFTFYQQSGGNTSGSTGGTAKVVAKNLVQWNMQQYANIQAIVYRSVNGGAFAYVGVTEGMDGSFVDWGLSTGSRPPGVPATPPSGTTNGMLSTTITGISGTTLTIAIAATATAASQAALHDNVPAVLAVCAAMNNNGSGTLSIPATNPQTSVPFNSPLDLYHNCPITQMIIAVGSTLSVNDPIIMRRAGTTIKGVSPSDQVATFGINFTTLITGTGFPFIYYVPGSFGPNTLENLNFNVTQPYQSAFVEDSDAGGGNVVNTQYTNDFFTGNGGTMPGIIKGGFNKYFDRGSFSSNGAWGVPEALEISVQNSLGMCPGCNVPAYIMKFDRMAFQGHGIEWDDFGHALPNIGGYMTVSDALMESAYMPLMTNLANASVLTQITFNRASYADFLSGPATPFFLLGTGSVPEFISEFSFCGSSNQPLFEGVSGAAEVRQGYSDGCSLIGMNTAIVTNFQGGTGSSFKSYNNFPVQTNGSGEFYYGMNIPPQPAVVVSSRGAVPVGTHSYSIAAVDSNGNTTTTSPAVGATTTTGNQTVTITPVSLPPGAIGYMVYRDGAKANYGNSGCAAYTPGLTSFLDSAGSVCGNSPSAINTAGSSSLGAGGLSGLQLSLIGGGYPSTISGTFTSAHTQTLPDVTGIIPVTGYINSAYDNFNRANAAIGSNWTVTGGGFNVASNAVQGTATSNYAFYSGATLLSPVQFAQTQVATLNGTSDFVGPVVLLSTGSNGYSCVENSTTLLIQKLTSGTGATLASSSSAGAVGDVLRLEVRGSGALTCARSNNGTVTSITATDTTWTTGLPGLEQFGNAATVDNWSGGNLHPLTQLDTEQDFTRTQHFVQGGIALGAELLSAVPRAEQNIFLPGALTSTWTASTWTTDKAITVTRVQVQAKTAPSACATNAVVRLTDGTTPVNLTVAAAANDSGSISQNYAAGAALQLLVQTAAAGCTTSPADANVVVQYRMQ